MEELGPNIFLKKEIIKNPYPLVAQVNKYIIVNDSKFDIKLQLDLGDSVNARFANHPLHVKKVKVKVLKMSQSDV